MHFSMRSIVENNSRIIHLPVEAHVVQSHLVQAEEELVENVPNSLDQPHFFLGATLITTSSIQDVLVDGEHFLAAVCDGAILYMLGEGSLIVVGCSIQDCGQRFSQVELINQPQRPKRWNVSDSGCLKVLVLGGFPLFCHCTDTNNQERQKTGKEDLVHRFAVLKCLASADFIASGILESIYLNIIFVAILGYVNRARPAERHFI